MPVYVPDTLFPEVLRVPKYCTPSCLRKWNSPVSVIRPIIFSPETESVPFQIPPGEALVTGGGGVVLPPPPPPPPQAVSSVITNAMTLSRFICTLSGGQSLAPCAKSPPAVICVNPALDEWPVTSYARD